MGSSSMMYFPEEPNQKCLILSYQNNLTSIEDNKKI